MRAPVLGIQTHSSTSVLYMLAAYAAAVMVVASATPGPGACPPPHPAGGRIRDGRISYRQLPRAQVYHEQIFPRNPMAVLFFTWNTAGSCAGRVPVFPVMPGYREVHLLPDRGVTAAISR